MKSHEQYAALLDAFIDGALSETEAAEVRAHLDGCPDCQAYVADALAMRDLFPGIEETVVPDGFAESVLAALPARKSRLLWRQPWMKAALPLAASVAIVLLLRGVSTLPRSGGAAASPEEANVMDAGGGMRKRVATDADADEEAVLDTDDESAADVTEESLMDAGGGPVAGSVYSIMNEGADTDGATVDADGATANSTADADGVTADSTADTGGNMSLYRYTDDATANSTADAGGVTTDSTADTGGNRNLYRYADGATEEVPEAEESTVSDKKASAAQDTAETTSAAPSAQNQSAETPLLGASSGMDGDTMLDPSAVPDGDTMPPNSTENADAVAPAPEPVIPAPEGVESAAAEAVTVSYWRLSPDAAPMLEGYPVSQKTDFGVWYALNPEQFDALRESLPESAFAPMDADSLAGNPPPARDRAPVYLFLPFS